MGFLDRLFAPKSDEGSGEALAAAPATETAPKPNRFEAFTHGPYPELNEFIRNNPDGITYIVANDENLVGIEIMDEPKPAPGEVTLLGQLLNVLKRSGVTVAQYEIPQSQLHTETLEFGVANRMRNGNRWLVRFHPDPTKIPRPE